MLWFTKNRWRPENHGRDVHRKRLRALETAEGPRTQKIMYMKERDGIQSFREARPKKEVKGTSQKTEPSLSRT